MGKGVVSILQGRISRDLQSQVGCRADEVPHAVGQNLLQLSKEIIVAGSSILLCGARLTQQWPGTCLSYNLKVVSSTLLGLSENCLGTPDAKCGIFPWSCQWYMAILSDTLDDKCGIFPRAYLWVVPLCRHVSSNHMCTYLTCASSLTCLLWLDSSLLNKSVMADWQTFSLTWVTPFCFICFMLSWPDRYHFSGPLSTWPACLLRCPFELLCQWNEVLFGKTHAF